MEATTGPETSTLVQQSHSMQGNQGSPEKGMQSGGDVKWSLVKDLSKQAGANWASPRSRGKLMLHQGGAGATCSRTTSSLTQIYSPPSHPMPSTSEGIVVQALSLVSDNPATHFSPGREPNLKKISKRRRKTNGEVDVEHTKSNNEFLRKIQQSLRDSQEDSSSEELRPEASEELLCTNWNEDASSQTSKTTASTSISDTSHRSSSLSASEISSNPYGYEDPDKVLAPIQVGRVPRIARRRGSVTEHTIRAAQKAAASAAAERAEKMQMSRKVDTITMAVAAAQRLQNIQGTSHRTLHHFQSRLQRSQMSLESVPASSMKPPQKDSSDSPKSNPYGYEDMDVPMHETSSAKEINPNPYGYEDPDARASQPPPSENPYGYEDPDASNSNPYGYGDPAPQTARPRMRARPQRRGSVTKYSLGAASSVAAANEDSNQDSDTKNEDKAVSPSLVARNLSPKQGLRQPTRKLSPYQTQDPSLVSRKAALPWTSAAPGAPTVHAPPSRSSSLSEFFNSNDILPGPDEEDSIDSLSSEESSLNDSFASITIPLKDEESKRDGPVRPPLRHDSAHSVRTFDSSDGDSLAPDMKSLCSISQHERFGASGSTLEPPTMLPQTTPPRSLSRKWISPHLSARSGQSKQAHAVERQGSGGLIAPLMSFVDTSPLESPKMRNRRGLYSGTSSFQGKMIYTKPELPDEVKFDL
jgi:hypothetical protein